jgi:serine O-acetyltransferase
MTWKRTWHLIRSDLRRRRELDRKSAGSAGGLGTVLQPGVIALIIWRFQHYFRSRRLMLPVKILGLINMVLFATEIESGAEIGEGFVLLNPNGIMIHDHTRIGRDCLFTHQVTISLGPRPGMDLERDYVTIGDRVVLSPGVRIIGNLQIGDDAWIGPNAVILHSVPARAIVPAGAFQPLSPAATGA